MMEFQSNGVDPDNAELPSPHSSTQQSQGEGRVAISHAVHRGAVDPRILAQLGGGSVPGKQHYRFLLDLVPGASAAPRVLLHAEHVPVTIVPGDKGRVQQGCTSAREPWGCSHGPQGKEQGQELLLDS